MVMKGPSKGDQLSVDHIIPRTAVPELDNVIANLELMPQRMNEKKNAKIGDRQRDMAKKLYQAGLLVRSEKTCVSEGESPSSPEARLPEFGTKVTNGKV